MLLICISNVPIIPDNEGNIITYISHDSIVMINVNGFDPPGSYVRKITYDAREILALEEVIDRAHRCRQQVIYKCHNAKLLANPGKCCFIYFYIVKVVGYLSY